MSQIHELNEVLLLLSFRQHRIKMKILINSKFPVFFLQVCVGGPNYIHVQVFQALPCYGGHHELSGVQEDKTQDHPLEPIRN